MLESGVRSVHFIGVGGVGMSAIAWVMLQHGVKVSGSDLEANAQTARLAEAGARIFLGHRPEHVADADLAVASSAIPEHNVERVAARERGIPVWRRAQALAAILETGSSIAIAGAHGKTTTTSMIGTTLTQAGLDPTVLVGGELNDFGGTARVGQGELIVAEADESDGSFLLMRPNTIVITNVEDDHLDYWKTSEALRGGYAEFLGCRRGDGALVACVDSPGVRQALELARAEAVTYSAEGADADWQALGIEVGPAGTRFICARHGVPLGEVRLAIPGRHMAANALAALAVAEQHGVEFNAGRQYLAGFRGVARRWQRIGCEDDVTVMDDYAHHPTEIAATLEAARATLETSGGRLFCVFQPHRFTRTQRMGEKFAGCFESADQALITDVYGAGETPIDGVTGALLHEAVKRNGRPECLYCADPEAALPLLVDRVRPGDTVVTMGAGNIYRLGPKILRALRERAAAAT